MIVAGIGARASATAADMVEAVRDACARAGIALNEVGVLAGLDRPETTAALGKTAALLNHGRSEPESGGSAGDNRTMDGIFRAFLGVEISLFSMVKLQQEANRCATVSARSMAATGVPSVAEAAALAAAGPEGMLLLPRLAFPTVTVALAIGPGGTQL
jgi:cobalt-precorrin 5A hydrolase